MIRNGLWGIDTLNMRERYPQYAGVRGLNTLFMRESVPSICVEILQVPLEDQGIVFR